MKKFEVMAVAQRMLAVLLTCVLLGPMASMATGGQDDHHDGGEWPPLVLAKQGNYYVGGEYNARNQMVGQMYVEYSIPRHRRHKYPIIMVHGGGQIGAGWNLTPDGREGWAQYFLRRGYAVYVVDQPARGRSPYNLDFGPLADAFDSVTAQNVWAAPRRAMIWPAAALHTRWVGPAVPGDPTFDQFMKSQSDALPLMPLDLQERLTASGLIALLDKLGPSILIPHSQPGSSAWIVADRRPHLLKALVQIEPGGPPVFALAPLAPSVKVNYGITSNPIAYQPAVSDPSQLKFEQRPINDQWVKSCWLQSEPARKLPNLSKVPTLLLSSPAGYNTLWDPCLNAYLDQAGVSHTWLKLQDIGIEGNGHFMFIEENSDQVAGVVLDWLSRHVNEHGQ